MQGVVAQLLALAGSDVAQLAGESPLEPPGRGGASRFIPGCAYPVIELRLADPRARLKLAGFSSAQLLEFALCVSQRLVEVYTHAHTHTRGHYMRGCEE
jgi:hypothetical protein